MAACALLQLDIRWQAVLSALATNTSLTCLHLNSQSGGWGWGAALASALPHNATLRTLRLHLDFGTTREAEPIFGALGDLGLQAIAPTSTAPEMPGLSVTLSGSGFRDIDASALAALSASLRSCGRLRALSLSPFEDRAGSLLGRGVRGTGVEQMYTQICEALLSVGEASQLHKLELSYYVIGDEGARSSLPPLTHWRPCAAGDLFSDREK